MNSPAHQLSVVTGASRGLGRAIALELLRAGHEVLLVARDEAALAQVASEANAKGKAHTLALDLETPGAVAALAARAEQLGGARVLINNAAIQGPIGPAWEVDALAFERTLRADFLVPVALCRALLPQMIARREGWIVNISGGGATSPRRNFSAYAAAKTALVRFGETLAAEAGPHGVRVNSVAPGAFSSGMTREVAAAGDAAGPGEQKVAGRLLAEHDDANAGKCAQLILYLTAGEGRDITGKLISARWDPWNSLHTGWDQLSQSDIYTLRRVVPPDDDAKGK
jgi:3-oxoacyl-[acyl-carrier protein] reductase